jgi:hypothetical protein
MKNRLWMICFVILLIFSFSDSSSLLTLIALFFFEYVDNGKMELVQVLPIILTTSFVVVSWNIV